MADARCARGPRDSDEDDAIARLLESTATAATLSSALRAAATAGDTALVDVVAAWLDLAQELGYAPSSRQVAAEAVTSHTAVNVALRRLRSYLRPEA